MCAEVALSRCLVCQVLWAVDGRFVSYKGIQGDFEKVYISGAGSVEESRLLWRHVQGCVAAYEGPKILTFSFRSRPVCTRFYSSEPRRSTPSAEAVLVACATGTSEATAIVTHKKVATSELLRAPARLVRAHMSRPSKA
jgi:hypothetical protein